MTSPLSCGRSSTGWTPGLPSSSSCSRDCSTRIPTAGVTTFPVAEDLGYTSEQIRGLRDGNLTLLDDDDRQVIEYVNAVMARSVTDGQFAAMRERFGDERLVKVTLLAGVYTMIGMAQSAMNVPQDEGFGGFECP